MFPKAPFSAQFFSICIPLLLALSSVLLLSITSYMLTTYNFSYPLFLQISHLPLTTFSPLSLSSHPGMSSNYLTLNPSKTEFLVSGFLQQTSKTVNPSLSLPSITPVMPSLSAKNIGFIFDSTLSFSKQISSLSSACHYHIRELRRIRHTLDFTTATTIVTALVHSRLDHCNSLCHSLPITQIKPLQHIQTELALAATLTPKLFHISPVLKSLVWLKVKQRIQYKIISITHYHCVFPFHLSPPGSSLPIDHFATPLPRLWNSLPTNLRSSLSLTLTLSQAVSFMP